MSAVRGHCSGILLQYLCTCDLFSFHFFSFGLNCCLVYPFVLSESPKKRDCLVHKRSFLGLLLSFQILMAAGDTFRAAPSDQLEIWAEGTGCEIVVAEGEKA